ncbi:hypothetical protein CHS0354_027622 [Potamilus streckersoni]|uniref:Uncharacterized protein n=1 Tax=Potamilus streckersoni TaxID=2493646 RepID=A0AAE0T0J7_9BIVA|nr:hypothetical protein CHS0354_027622 [Potamilus streckersoni]
MSIRVYPKVNPKGYPKRHPKGYPKVYPEGYPKVYPKGYPKVYPKVYPTGYPKVYPKGYPKVYPKGKIISPRGFLDSEKKINSERQAFRQTDASVKSFEYTSFSISAAPGFSPNPAGQIINAKTEFENMTLCLGNTCK